MTDNVVKFEPRPRKVPALSFEVRLGYDFSIEISLFDSTGVVGTRRWDLTPSSPPDFDLDRLRVAWEESKDDPTEVAS